jgi:hypothetical protein
MPKVIVVSYNDIKGVPIGRYEKGDAVAYSAEWGSEIFTELAVMSELTGLPFYDNGTANEQEVAAEGAVSRLEQQIGQDLSSIETVYVYVGVSAKDKAFNLIKKLQSLGKTVHMVACDCDYRTKTDFADRLGIDIIWTECGGEQICGEIFRKFSAPAPIPVE